MRGPGYGFRFGRAPRPNAGGTAGSHPMSITPQRPMRMASAASWRSDVGREASDHSTTRRAIPSAMLSPVTLSATYFPSGALSGSGIQRSQGSSQSSRPTPAATERSMGRLRPLVNRVQEALWGAGPYPPRTIIEVSRLNQDDIFEVEGTFYAPKSR